MFVGVCRGFRGVVVVGVLVCGFVLLVPAFAFGGFSRSFVRSVGGVPVGPGGSVVPFSGPGGVAVDGAGDLWVADIGASGTLDEFDASGVFVGPAPGPMPLVLKENLTLPESLAIEDSTGHFYVTGRSTREAFPPRVEVFDSAGGLLRRSTEFGKPAHVVVDNSSDPFDLSVGSVYVAHGSADPEVPFSDGLPQGIAKFDGSGSPVSFSGSAGYIKGNQITGFPGESFSSGGKSAPGSLAVDREGHIYALDANYNVDQPGKIVGAVVEFSPTGLFVRAFTGEENPGLGGVREGWGVVPDSLSGVAVDPVSGHVLVSIATSEGVGAVDEFDSTGHFLEQITETSSGASLGSALEMVFDANGDLYVVDRVNHVVDVYGPGRFLPSVTVGVASGRTRVGAVLNGTVDPERLGLSECYFEYVDEAHYHAGAGDPYEEGGRASCEPAASAIPVDSSAHEVSASVGGLVSGTTYRYRLVARTEGSLGGLADSQELSFTAPHEPAIESTFANNISSVFADLRTEVDPLGAATSYSFEYVDQAHYEVGAEDPYSLGAVAPASEVGIGSGDPTGNLAVKIAQQVGNLSPGTTYHFRVVAKNEIGVTFGPDVTFSTLPRTAPGLSDGRAYELLTPSNKGSAEDMFALPETELHFFDNQDVGYPSDSGEEFLLETRAAFGSFSASGNNSYVFRRTGVGWQTLPLASPALGVQSVSPEVFDPSSFSQIGILDGAGSVPSIEGPHELSLVGPPGGPYGTIHSEAGTTGITHMVGASRDLKHIALETTDHTLLAADKSQDPGSKALYEWSEGEFSLMNLNHSGALLRCGAILGQSGGKGARHNAVSTDGSRAFFTAPDPYARNMGSGCWNGASENTPQLYMRSAGKTTEISLAETGVSDPTGLHPAVFANASEDGSKIFFITDGELTKNDAGIHDPELYEYDTETGKLARVSRGEFGIATGDVYTVPAVSADGSVVYFTAFGKLTSNAPVVSGKEHEHEVNLYRYDTESGTTTYVATVDTRDYPSSETRSWWPTDIPPEPSLATNASWYTTPDGRYLLFASTKELTGFSTVQESTADCPIIDSGGGGGGNFGRCSEVYRYDSVNRSLACVSCDPSGASPASNAYFGHGAGPGAPAGGPVRAMSDDGSLVFFDTTDALVPQDTNGTQDIYEWEAQNNRDCEQTNGCLRLITSGQNRSPSFLLGASADGSNVFFGTHARLVAQDTDEAGDIYDARINGGYPVQGGTGPCEGNACENPPPTPIDAIPGSLTFSGAGNLTTQTKTHTKTKKKTKPKKTKKKTTHKQHAKTGRRRTQK